MVGHFIQLVILTGMPLKKTQNKIPKYDTRRDLFKNSIIESFRLCFFSTLLVITNEKSLSCGAHLRLFLQELFLKMEYV